MPSIYLEGNGGADYLQLTQDRQQKKRGMVSLEVGHCCTAIGNEIPVEVITAILHSYLIQHADVINSDGTWEFNQQKLIDSLDWKESFKNELKQRC